MVQNGAGNGTGNGSENGAGNEASNGVGSPTNTGSQASRRASRSRTKTAASSAAKHQAGGNSAVELEDKMSEAEKTMASELKNGEPKNGETSAVKAGKLELASKPQPPEETGLAVHQDGELEVAESYSEAGIRPIEASHLEVYGTIMNNRPVEVSHLQVIEYIGNRPIFASELVVCDDLTLPGGRPIVASDPHLMNSHQITGGRPIASNDLGDGSTLMGYLD